MTDALDDPPGIWGGAPTRIAPPLVDVLIARHASLQRSVFVALDGRSGAGKSTLAAVVARACSSRGVVVTVIEGDDFYGGGTAEGWDQRSAAENVDHVIDWRRQHRVIDDLRLLGSASWHPFDWDSPDWNSDRVPLRSTPVSVQSAAIVVLEGAYSARPELHDVLDIRVLLDTPPQQRRRQLLAREGDQYRSDWEARWSAAEDHYFVSIMPPGRFDYVL
jgi:uridine kinase